MKNAKIGFILFWIVSLLHISSIYINSPLLGYVTKPFLMIFLGFAFYRNVQLHQIPFNKIVLVYIALFFSFLGDIFLMIPGEQAIWFMLGVFVFMVAQISYAVLYMQFRIESTNRSISHQLLKLGLITIMLLFIINLWINLRPGLGDLLVPVSVYSAAIFSMAIAAILRYKRTTDLSFWIVLFGAITFIASDSMIAINKFLSPIEGERYLVMSTYILAQYLIIKGLIYHIKAS